MKAHIQLSIAAMIFVVIATGCRKDEYIPPPEGEKVGYVDPRYQPLGEILKTTTLFLKLVEQSNMDSLLTTKAAVTLLVPSDVAMQAAGYSASVINAMDPLDADTIVALHVVRNMLTKEELLRASGSLQTASLLKKKGLYVGNYYYGNEQPNNISRDAYWYRQVLRGTNGKLILNGIVSGDLDKSMPAKNAYVYTLDRVLTRPVDESFWSYLEKDPRFSIFINLQKKVDEIFDLKYRRIYEDNTGWDPGGYGWIDNRRTNYALYYDIAPDYSGDKYASFSTMYAPTNEAFHAAGFQSVEDVLAANAHVFGEEPIFDWNTWEIAAFGYMSDSILAYHWDYGFDNLPYSSIYGKPRPVSQLFYADDLRNDYLGNFVLSNAVGRYEYKMTFTFGEKNGKPTVQVKGSNAEPATVTETINTLNGPLHVVDRLLIPKDLKMK